MVKESFVSRNLCSFWTRQPAPHGSALITHINCGLFDMLCECIFPVNAMKISSVLTQKEQSKYHLHTFEFGLNINERKSMQLLAGNEHEVTLAGPWGREKQQIVSLPLKTSSKPH